MRKTFVLDTNVLIHDPESIFKFEENDVVIPMVVIEELDRLKKGHGEIAYSARHALKNIDRLREKGSIAAGVQLETGGTVTIEYIPHLSNILSPDNAIIKTALHIMENTNKDKYRPVILVSKDTAVRIKAESVGLHAEDYKNDKTAIFQRYGNVLNDNDYHDGIFSVRYKQSGEDIYRLQGKDKQSKIKRGKSLENIIPKNIEQECAIDALTNFVIPTLTQLLHSCNNPVTEKLLV